MIRTTLETMGTCKVAQDRCWPLTACENPLSPDDADLGMDITELLPPRTSNCKRRLECNGLFAFAPKPARFRSACLPHSLRFFVFFRRSPASPLENLRDKRPKRRTIVDKYPQERQTRTVNQVQTRHSLWFL